MTTFCEVKIRIKDDSVKLEEKFAVYSEGFRISRDDPELASMVDKALKKYKGDDLNPDVTVLIRYEW